MIPGRSGRGQGRWIRSPRITVVSAPVRCAATKLATGWSSAATPSPSVTSSISTPAPTAADVTTTSPSAVDMPNSHGGRSRATTTEVISTGPPDA
jgi:hypothetical protein